MDLFKNLKAELENKRKYLQQSGLIDERRKFFKREELNKKTEEEYWHRQAEKEEKRRQQKCLATGNSGSVGDGDPENSGSPPGDDAMKLKKLIANQTSSGDGDKHSEMEERILPRKEVIKRLRERNQPILLFAETETDAFKRLTRLEIQEPESSDKGFRNDFQEAMEKVDAAYLEEIVKSGRDGGGTSSGGVDGEKKRGTNDVKVEEMNTTIEEILQQAQYLGRQRSKRPSVDDEQRKSDCAVILKFLKFLLELWGRKLNDRPEPDKRSTQGRLLTAIYTQTQDYLKPMFKQLTKQSIADDILKHLILIVKYLLERNYVKANDCYLQMAIGNAPWPIGVTMVGIHARTGREKIFAQNIAHVLNDETQRKYIQGLKRLMTQCQKMFPTDPSRCVEYTKD